MKRIGRCVMSLLAVGLVTSALVPACATNDQSIFIRGALAPSANRTGGVCLYNPDPTAPALFTGTLDVGIRDNYQAVLLVGNQMIPRGDPTDTRAESNRVHLNGAIVKVQNPDGSGIREFTSLATGFADTQTNNNPSFGLMGVAIVDAPTRDILASQLPDRNAVKTVVAQIKAFGKTLGGVDVESGEFQFSIRVCNGCLVSFVGANDPALQPQPNCLKAVDASSTTSTPCFPGQDEPTPCQLCQGRPACNP
jgi:hypothetical protein